MLNILGLGRQKIENETAGLNRAQRLMLAICHGGNSFKDYKAPHAYRGTPPRPRSPRAVRKRPLFRA